MKLPVAEPDPDHFLLHGETVGEKGNFLGGRLWILHECLLQRDAHARLDWGALLSPPTDRLRRRHWIRQRVRIVKRVVRVLEPLLQQWLQLAHVFERQIQSLEPADTRPTAFINYNIYIMIKSCFSVIFITISNNRLLKIPQIFWK